MPGDARAEQPSGPAADTAAALTDMLGEGALDAAVAALDMARRGDDARGSRLFEEVVALLRSDGPPRR